MIGPKEACKYLIIYPFSPLTAVKTHNVVQYLVALICWKEDIPAQGMFLLFIPITDILGLALSIVSLWFMVQKFYWKKLEIGMNAVAIFMTLLALLTIIAYPSLNIAFVFIHLFALLGWIFSLLWSWQKTSNTVSNLFIANWGEATTDLEIEALEDHF